MFLSSQRNYIVGINHITKNLTFSAKLNFLWLQHHRTKKTKKKSIPGEVACILNTATMEAGF